MQRLPFHAQLTLLLSQHHDMSSRSTHSATSSAVLAPAMMSGNTEGSSSPGSAALPLPRRSHSSMRACTTRHVADVSGAQTSQDDRQKLKAP